MAVTTFSVFHEALRRQLAEARRRMALQATIAASARLLLCVSLGALAWALANYLRGNAVVEAPLILTSLASDDDRRRGMEAGADGYIVKSSFDEQSLLAAVDRLVGTPM